MVESAGLRYLLYSPSLSAPPILHLSSTPLLLHHLAFSPLPCVFPSFLLPFPICLSATIRIYSAHPVINTSKFVGCSCVVGLCVASGKSPTCGFSLLRDPCFLPGRGDSRAKDIARRLLALPSKSFPRLQREYLLAIDDTPKLVQAKSLVPASVG